MERSALKTVFQSDLVTLAEAGLEAYQPSIALLLQRLAAERLVERLWSGDPSLWYPAAETQARIRSRLGWRDLPTAAATELDTWLALLQARQVTDVLYVGLGDAGLLARLWRDLVGAAAAPRFTLLDTIEPAQVWSVVEAVAWERTAVVLTLEAEPTPDQEALLSIVGAARAQASTTLPLLVLAPPDAALPATLDSHDAPVVLPLPPDVGARFGALSPLGFVPAALLGCSVDRLTTAALELRAACQHTADLGANPGVWLGTVLAALAQQGRDKLVLLASPGLLPLARWIAAFVSGSLSKHGRGFVSVVAEAGVSEQTNKQTTEQSSYRSTRQSAAKAPSTADRIVVALRLAGVDDPALDAQCAAFQAAGLPLLSLEPAHLEAVAALVVCWQVAVATVGVVLGLNPFDEPDTDARHAYLRRRLEQPVSSFRTAAAPLKPAMLAAALQQLQITIRGTGCLVLVAYLPSTPAIAEHLHALRLLLARRFGVPTGIIEPLRDMAYATQVLHAGRPCTVLLLTAEPAALVAVPDMPWTLNDLQQERIAADMLAWNTMRRSFVHFDLGAAPERELQRYLRLLA